ncbi:peptidase C39 family protein [Leucobacter soli]
MNETASTAPLAASIDDGAALPALSTEPSIDASSGVLADGSGAMPGEARLALWRIERDLWAPRTVRVTDASGRIVATALTAGRPHAAYRKIVDVLAIDAAAFRAAVAAAADDAPTAVDGSRPAPIVVKFEEHPALAPLDAEREAMLADLGFVRDPDPLPSVPSTRPGSDAFTRSWSKWLGAAPTRPAPYYGQTTDVTCGAVTALMSLERSGLGRLRPDDAGGDASDNQNRELDFWRRATNLPACEPIGLAVATAGEIGTTGLTLRTPRVILSTEELVLLEEWRDQPFERRLREQLQHDSLRQAAELGVEIERRWVPVEEIRDLVVGGADVFLLIALAP